MLRRRLEGHMNQKKALWKSVALTVVASAVALQLGTERAQAGRSEDDRHGSTTFVVDVAVDMRTFAAIPSTGNPPGEPVGPNRGTTFIVNGKIFPAGALPSGAASNDPSEAGSIGDWVCRGILTSDLASQLAGVEKIGFDTTQMLIFGSDRRAIWSEGLEGGLSEAGVTTHRIVLGGTGVFLAASGDVVQESLGTNVTGAPNLRLTFRLRNHD
jgi:hypothetical protein